MDIRRSANRFLRRKQGLAMEALSFILLMAILVLAIALYLARVIRFLDILYWAGAGILALLGLAAAATRQRHQTLHIAFTSRHLLKADVGKIDDLLGMLIGGRWHAISLDPVEEFFRTLLEICRTENVEMKRRISEALPALFEIDLEESRDVVRVLRRDWDTKWSGDNRRRTIEALGFLITRPRPVRHVPRVVQAFVREGLRVVERDEVFTLVALVEVLDLWRHRVNGREAQSMFEGLLATLRARRQREDEIACLQLLWDLLDKLQHDPEREGRLELLRLSASTNENTLICVARNIRRTCNRYPECVVERICDGSPSTVLELMTIFLGDKPRNVRRPMARENSLECLILLLQQPHLRKRAGHVIWTLMTDADDIIRMTAFDKVDRLYDANPALALKVARYLAYDDPHPIQRLVDRAKSVLGRNT